MSVTLYRKYRPQRWSDVAGQNHVKVTLAFEVATGKTAHAYIFSGPRGVGKTTTARIFAKAVNCEKLGKEGEPCDKCGNCEAVAKGSTLDIIEIDAASHRGIDAVRENIIENARFSPSRLKRKVFIIDEVHMMTTEAFNALLKTLEEPPEGVVFILATTELHKVPATIVSRCQRFDFRKIPFTDMVERLQGLAEGEKAKVDEKVLQEIARHAEGCLRDAEGLLGKVLAIGDGKRVTYDEALVVLPRSDYALAAQYVEALLRREARIALQTIGDCLEEGVDLDQFAADVIELMRKVLLTKMSGNPDAFASDLDEERKAKLSEWAELAETTQVVHALETLVEKRRDMKSSRPPQLPLELAAVIVCEEVPARRELGGGSGTASGSIERVAAGLAPARPNESAGNDVAAGLAPARSGDAAGKGVAAGLAPARSGKPQPTRDDIVAEVKKVEATKASSAATVAAAETASGEPVVTVSKVRGRWKDFISKVGEVSHSLTFLLSAADPVEVVGKTLRIGFEFPFHRDKLNQDRTRQTVENALNELFGEDMRVEGVLLEKKRRVGHDDAAEDEASTPETAHAQSGSVAQNLATAFGGRVIE